MRARQSSSRNFDYTNPQMSLLDLKAMANGFDNPDTPPIAGVTITGFGNAIPGGYEIWQQETPQQRFANSALGQMTNYMADQPTKYTDWVNSNSYWGEMARNIVTGSGAMYPNIQSVSPQSGVQGEGTWADTAERAFAEGSQGKQPWDQAALSQQAYSDTGTAQALQSGDPMMEAAAVAGKFGIDPNSQSGSSQIAGIMDLLHLRGRGRR